MRTGLVILALGLALAAAGAARAQVTFQSLEVLGFPVAGAEGEAKPASPVLKADNSVRFWTDNTRSWRLEGFGCQFEMAAWPNAGPGDEALTDILTTDLESYRKSASSSAVLVTPISQVFTGRLYRAGTTPPGKDTYGLECSDKVATALALDVITTAATRQLHIFIVQVNLDDLAQGKTPRKTMAKVLMKNIIFHRGDEADVARSAAVTNGLWTALTGKDP